MISVRRLTAPLLLGGALVVASGLYSLRRAARVTESA